MKITNEQLIQIAAVDSGLDPFAEYCTKGMWCNAGYKVKPGESPILTVELWCPRERKNSAGDLLSNGAEPQQGDTSVSSMFFQFKTCHLFTRSQVVDAQELAAEKEAAKARKAHEKQFKQAVLAQGGIKPSIDYSIPQWCKRSAGLAIDVAAGELSSAGYPVQDADELYVLLAM